MTIAKRSKEIIFCDEAYLSGGGSLSGEGDVFTKVEGGGGQSWMKARRGNGVYKTLIRKLVLMQRRTVCVL